MNLLTLATLAPVLPLVVWTAFALAQEPGELKRDRDCSSRRQRVSAGAYAGGVYDGIRHGSGLHRARRGHDQGWSSDLPPGHSSHSEGRLVARRAGLTQDHGGVKATGPIRRQSRHRETGTRPRRSNSTLEGGYSQ